MLTMAIMSSGFVATSHRPTTDDAAQERQQELQQEEVKHGTTALFAWFNFQYIICEMYMNAGVVYLP